MKIHMARNSCKMAIYESVLLRIRVHNSQLPWQFVVIGKSALISFRFQSSKNLCIILGDVHYYYGLKIFLKEHSNIQPPVSCAVKAKKGVQSQEGVQSNTPSENSLPHCASLSKEIQLFILL